MRIAIFTNNYLPNPYGVANSIESFRKQFERLGHAVYVFAPHTKGYFDENPNVFRYPSIDIKYKISFPLAIPYSPKISKALSELNLDIIHSQHPTLLGKTAMKWARKKNIPLVFTWHTLHDKYVHFVPLIPKKIAAWWIIKQAVNYADKSDIVIVPTDSVREIIRKWGVRNKNLVSVPTGVEESLYQNPEGQKIKGQYGIEKNEILLFLVCRLAEEKNIEFIFQSVINVLKSAKEVKFLIGGEGHLVPTLKTLVSRNKLEDRVIFAGAVKKEEIKNYYAAADIFVYGSKSETQGMIVSEAMYAGLPIVAVNATGLKDLIKNNVNGLLVPENKTVFAEAVNKLVADAELRKSFGENSARIAREKYTDSVCAGKMLAIYKTVMENKKFSSSQNY